MTIDVAANCALAGLCTLMLVLVLWVVFSPAIKALCRRKAVDKPEPDTRPVEASIAELRPACVEVDKHPGSVVTTTAVLTARDKAIVRAALTMCKEFRTLGYIPDYNLRNQMLSVNEMYKIRDIVIHPKWDIERN